MQKRFAVVEEIDPLQRRAGFVDDAAEQLEVEHARLARPRDTGFGRADRLSARDVAGGSALDVHLRRHRAGIDGSHGRRFVLLERRLQRAVTAELRSAGVQLFSEPRDGRAAPHVLNRGRADVAQDAARVRVGAPADDAAVAEHDQRVPGPAALEARREVIQRHSMLIFWSAFSCTLRAYRSRTSPC